MSQADSWSALFADLTEIGRDDRSGGYRRFAWTRADHELREWFAAQAAARSLDLVTDRAGNQWAWWGDPDADGPGVVTGSHLDSVPDGGAFDGPLGVTSAFAAVDALRAAGSAPSRPLGVVNFVDEEGARFGVACAGSRVITGALDADRARGLTDGDGVSLAQAWRRAGRTPEQLGADPETLGRVGCFVELHVEQGRGLIDLDSAVAVGSEIWPHGRWRLDLPGRADHAGTTRLEDRSDALLALAELITETRAVATAHGCLATVGKISIAPGGVNAIASTATGWLDARGADVSAVHAAVADLRRSVERRGGSLREESWTDPTAFDAGLTQRLCRTLPGAPVLATGAGHDAGILAAAGIPTGMIFVRNPSGISHSPAEFAEGTDCRAGVAALTAVLAELTDAVPAA